MVWTNADTESFFTGAQKMAIPTATVSSGLIGEGIATVDDLDEFNNEDLKSVLENMRKPAGTMPDPSDGRRRIPRQPYIFGAKSFKRIKVAASAVRYYKTIGREITPTNMHYVNVLKDYGEQWEAILSKEDKDEPDTPKITRALPIVRWTESFEDFLHQIIGSRHIALSYIIRDDVQPENPPPPLIDEKCYSEKHGSAMGELISRATHEHVKYKDDNAKLYSYLEEATRTTQYASSIRPFSKTKDGREAYLSLKRQYAGKDKWQSEIKKQESFIHNRVWKGNSNFTLESFITQHRAAHVSLERCAQSVPHQLPNERTRVIHLMDAIQCSDASLQAAIAHIKSQSDDPDGMGNKFEDASAYLLQFCPVAKRSKSSSTNTHNISSVDMESRPSYTNNNRNNRKRKPNKGDTGVELRYYKPQEYRKLSSEQIEELRKWRQEKGLSNSKKKKHNGNFKDQVIAASQQYNNDEEAKNSDKDLIKRLMIPSTKDEKVGAVHTSKASTQSKTIEVDREALNAIVRRLK